MKQTENEQRKPMILEKDNLCLRPWKGENTIVSNSLNDVNAMQTYSSVWKQGILFIQSIDWKSMRDVASQMKLVVGMSSCSFDRSSWVIGLGGVMTNTLLLSVINGPAGKESRSFGDNRSFSMRVALSSVKVSVSDVWDDRASTYVQLFPNNVSHERDIDVAEEIEHD